MSKIPVHLPTDFQEIIYKTRYARWLEDESRRENFNETVDRYINCLKNKVSEYSKDIAEFDELWNRIRNAVINLEVMPSMRLLMTSGAAVEKCNVAAYNCAYIPVDSLRSFDETMYILMCGTGVGFSVERQYVSQLPIIAEHFESSETVIRPKDSKSGWARAFKELLNLLSIGQIPTWDLSLLRPAGAKLKTFGGRSSGPEPLNELFKTSVAIFTNAKGRKLTSLECHDIMCKIGEVVVVGGVRRSALISLSNLSDDRMRTAKSGQWWLENPQRSLANNSACYTEKPDVEIFMKEWLSLIESKSGERGIFNRQAAIDKVKSIGRRNPEFDFGTNPCCVSKDTLILTNKGHVPISEAVGKLTDIWNGEEWASVTPFEAGIARLYRVNLSDGSYLDCTSNHKFVLHKNFSKDKENTEFVKVLDLVKGAKLAKFSMPIIQEGADYEIDAYSQGFYSGDGNTDLKFSWLYDTKFCCEKRLIGDFSEPSKYEFGTNRKTWKHGKMLPKDFVPIFGSLQYCLNWLAGLLDSDGTVTRDKNGNGFQISSINKQFLNNTKLMLTRVGIRAKLCKGKISGKYLLPNGLGGLSEYNCRDTWRLLIGNLDSYNLLEMGLKTERLDHNGIAPQRDARRFVTVESIEDLNKEEMTYCFEEPKTHRGTFNGIVTGQSEIILRPNQFCNLTEVVVRANDTIEELAQKVRTATILGTIQSLFTDFKYLRKIWKDNTEEERLLGVSLTGILDRGFTPKELDFLRETAIAENVVWSETLGISHSAAITCVKPSGTVSQLVDAASGIHPRHSKFYIRTIRGDKKDPITKFLMENSIPYEDDIANPNSTVVFSFPIKAPVNAQFREDLSAIEHLEFWKMVNDHWCEHKPSITISVKEHEWVEVGSWVFKNFDKLSGISFLPYSNHAYKQAPYQEITEKEYLDFLNKMPQNINWNDLPFYEFEDTTTGSQELACTGGVCEIVDFGK